MGPFLQMFVSHKVGLLLNSTPSKNLTSRHNKSVNRPWLAFRFPIATASFTTFGASTPNPLARQPGYFKP